MKVKNKSKFSKRSFGFRGELINKWLNVSSATKNLHLREIQKVFFVLGFVHRSIGEQIKKLFCSVIFAVKHLNGILLSLKVMLVLIIVIKNVD
jgi:hypothetical protein